MLPRATDTTVNLTWATRLIAKVQWDLARQHRSAPADHLRPVRGPDAADFGIRAFSGGSPEPLTPQELEWRAEALQKTVDLLAAGDFTIELGPELPLDQAARAHELMETGAASGKIILVP